MAIHGGSNRKLTYEDYARIPNDGRRHEILDGAHHVSPAPLVTHQRIGMNLLRVLLPFTFEHRLGHVYGAPTDVVLSPHDVVQPDILFVTTARLGILTRPNVQGAPDLVVEILSESTRWHDQTKKLGRYEKLGVQEVWFFDPRRRTARIHRRIGAAGFGVLLDLGTAAGDTLATPLLPGLEIPVAEMFE